MNKSRQLPALLLIPALFVLVFSSCATAQQPAKTIVNPAELSNTTQYGYSQATIVAPGIRTVYVSGQVGWDANATAANNSFELQVDRAFINLIATLKATGARPEDVVKITLLIKDHNPDKLAYLITKRRAIFGASPPASTLIPVTALYAKDVSFEIDAIAVVSAQ